MCLIEAVERASQLDLVYREPYWDIQQRLRSELVGGEVAVSVLTIVTSCPGELPMHTQAAFSHKLALSLGPSQVNQQ